ncbi:hypothetical protein O181_057424 [Austropuccinia psidii MF-1]|uniref:C2H2-type domain-containing protein n=1 Tax=Austropuccinia psidii MF-1 TaxID=1389203 RepID=A0A9Q3EAF3_9BASI|nr:hypothetical protein [Austropuccinia psidii MF-1]
MGLSPNEAVLNDSLRNLKRRRSVDSFFAPKPSPASSHVFSVVKSLKQSSKSSTIAYCCRLPPTCDPPMNRVSRFTNLIELESHHRSHHAFVCSQNNCSKIFPSERFLELHLCECHDPISDIKRERNQKTFACFEPYCERLFRTPKSRRLHLIDHHHYPPTFFFSLPNQGLNQLYQKYGPGVSLVRPSWKSREQADLISSASPSGPTSSDHPPALGNSPAIDDQSISNNTPYRTTYVTHNFPEQVDVLVQDLQQVSLIPRQIRFGHKNQPKAFQR